ncbi:MAG: V-type ATPase subunit [Clostridia bacterium]|nr:V-type ATPase subunit [Clostridia bacterium]
MPVKSSGFAIGNLRARENALLKSSDLLQLAGLKSTGALANALRDRGFGNRTGNEEVPQLLTAATEQLWHYLNEIVPEQSIFHPFLLENDFHNVKVLLKALVRQADGRDSLLSPYTVAPTAIRTALTEKRYDLLPDYMRAPVLKSYEALVTTGDAQLCDGLLDAACMQAQLDLVGQKGYPSDLARDILTETVRFNTLKAAIRSARAGKDAAFLNDILVETPFLSKDRLRNAALGGVEKVLELMEKIGGTVAEAATAYRQSPSYFEQFCDNQVMQIARRAKRITMGVEPLIGYYMARTAEIRNLRIIYSGIKTGQPQEIIVERLRELYG